MTNEELIKELSGKTVLEINELPPPPPSPWPALPPPLLPPRRRRSST